MESSKQVAPIAYLTKKVEILHKYNDELWDLFGQVLDYLNEMSGERRSQYLLLIKEIYEAKLAERYNTRELQHHRENTLIHYSDKKDTNNKDISISIKE